jgi:type II secretory pathway pseudopilin PulG
MTLHNTIHREKGFTLIETFVAISILVTVLGGTLTLVVQGLSASYTARDQVTAFYLAIEAVEYVRSIRDNNALDVIYGGSSNWLAGLGPAGSSCLSTEGCIVDATEGTVLGCSVSGCPPLNFNESTGFYTYTGGTPTTFIRTVHVTEVISDREALVEVEIIWKTKSRVRSFTVEESMFDWGT